MPESIKAMQPTTLTKLESTISGAFLDYWLDLRKLSETTPDQTLYPEYYLDDLLLEVLLGDVDHGHVS